MDWYKNMSKQQQKKFKGVIAVFVAGVLLVLFIPRFFRSF